MTPDLQGALMMTARFALFAAVPLILAAPSATLAQSTSETVKLTMEISQPSLFDSDRRDTFSGMIDDRSGTTTFEVECSAGASAWLGLSRIDEACSVAGNGLIKNPNNPAQTLPRIAYSGGFTIQAGEDGYTDASTIAADYLRAGAAGASSEQVVGGHLVMHAGKPLGLGPGPGRGADQEPAARHRPAPKRWTYDDRDRLDPLREFHRAPCRPAVERKLFLDRRRDLCLCQRMPGRSNLRCKCGDDRLSA
jgi:hypothetical protein